MLTYLILQFIIIAGKDIISFNLFGKFGNDEDWDAAKKKTIQEGRDETQGSKTRGIEQFRI